MKTVFNNSQLCHVWAQQTQDHGTGNNMFFSGDSIYSYGHHYLAAKIYTTKNGRKFALINSYKYSNTTIKHLYKIQDALNGLMVSFNCPRPDEPKHVDNLNYYRESVLNAIEYCLSKNKVTELIHVDWQIERIAHAAIEANRFFDWIGVKERIEVPKEMIDLCREYLLSRYERYKELNTPEMIAKRQALTDKRNAQKHAKEVEAQATAIEQWKNGLIPRLNFKLTYDLVRVRFDNVETSRGASVPLSHALRLLTLVERGTARSGERVGHFTLSGVSDGIVRIGCHTIELKQAKEVLEPYRNMELKIVNDDQDDAVNF